MNFSPLITRLQNTKRLAIFTHQRPDADALGSQLAAALIAQQLDVQEIHLMHFAPPPAFLEFLTVLPKTNGGIIQRSDWSSEWAGLVGGALDTILIVDTCTYNQLEPAAAFLKTAREKIIAIDHHQTRDDLSPLILADTTAAACVEILHDLAAAAKVPLSESLALPLMAGLVADTGWFRFDSVTPRTHQVAAALTPFVNNSKLFETLSQNDTKPRLALMTRALSTLAWHHKDQLATMTLTQKDFTETNAAPDQSGGFVDLPMSIKSTEVVAVLTESNDGRVRCSLRSKRNVDVNAICKLFGGGGHIKASGCKIEGTLQHALTILSAEIAKHLPVQ